MINDLAKAVHDAREAHARIMKTSDEIDGIRKKLDLLIKRCDIILMTNAHQFGCIQPGKIDCTCWQRELRAAMGDQ